MTITTMPWTSDGVGDGPLGGHGVEISRRYFRERHLTNPAKQGVIRSVLNELEATSPGVDSINVERGSADVYGTQVHSDAVTALALTRPAADTAGIVTIGIDWTGGVSAAQTGFIRAIQAVSGDTAFPSPSQVDLTSWEIEIARYIIDSAGVIYTDTGKGTTGPLDVRRFVGQILESHRQGGSKTTWSFAGTDDFLYIPSQIQSGAIDWTGGAVSNANQDVTFPVAFANFPQGFAQIRGDTTPDVLVSAGVLGATSMRIYWQTISGTRTTVNLSWWAIGEIANE